MQCHRCGQALDSKLVSRRTCSNACRQAAYRDRKLGKAHQRIVRERLAKLDPGPHPVADTRTAQVRPITNAEARDLILRYEWLGSMPAVVTHCFGITFAGRLGGAVAYGPDPTETLGVWIATRSSARSSP